MRRTTRGGKTLTKTRGKARTATTRKTTSRRPSIARGRSRTRLGTRTLARKTPRKTPTRVPSIKTDCVPVTVVPEDSQVIKGRTLKWFIALNPKLHEAGTIKIEIFPEAATRTPIRTISYNKNQMVVAVDTEIVREAPLDYAVLTACIGNSCACGIVVFRPVAFN